MPAMAKVRLDKLLVDRGLAPSRERARALIMSGVVLVRGQPATKAGTQVTADADVTLKEPDHPLCLARSAQTGQRPRHLRARPEGLDRH